MLCVCVCACVCGVGCMRYVYMCVHMVWCGIHVVCVQCEYSVGCVWCVCGVCMCDVWYVVCVGSMCGMCGKYGLCVVYVWCVCLCETLALPSYFLM